MVDRVLAGARGAPLKADQLIDEPIVIKKVHTARIDERQEPQIYFASRLVGHLVVDAKLSKLLARPLAAVCVPGDFGNPVTFEHIGKFLGYRFRTEGRLNLAN